MTLIPAMRYGQPPPVPVTRQEFLALRDEVRELRRLIERLLNQRTLTDQSHSPFQPQPDLAGTIEQLPPWVSNSVRFISNLTSADSARATRRDTLTAAGCTVALAFVMSAVSPEAVPLKTAALASAGVSTLTFVALVVNKELLKHKAIGGQKQGRQVQELDILVHYDGKQSNPDVDRFLACGITQDKLRNLAALLLRYETGLSVNTIAGGGKVVSQGQYQAFRREAIKVGYFTDTEPSDLTAKGKAFLRGLCDG